MLRFDLSRLSVHPVEPRAAGPLPPTVRPKGHRLNVVLILAVNEPLKPFMVGPPAGTVSKNNRMARRQLARLTIVRRSAYRIDSEVDMGENKINLSDLLETHRRDRERLAWEGTFRDYFELVTQNPNVSKLSHARICDMVLAAGVDKINEGSRDEIVKYNFFSEELFGIERPISKIVEYFKSAGQRLEVRKRILLLMGPVGGGKSTIVTMLKRGLERWSRT